MKTTNTTKKQSANMAKLLKAYEAGNVEAGNCAFRMANLLTKELTAFGSFDEMLKSVEHGYVPTLRPDLGDGYKALADAYDFAQARAGKPQRAWRGL